MVSSNTFSYFVNGEVFRYLHGKLSPSTFSYFNVGEVFPSAEYFSGAEESGTGNSYTSGAVLNCGLSDTVSGKMVLTGTSDFSPQIIIVTSGSSEIIGSIDIDMGCTVGATAKIKCVGTVTMSPDLALTARDNTSANMVGSNVDDVLIGVSMSTAGHLKYRGRAVFLADLTDVASGAMSYGGSSSINMGLGVTSELNEANDGVGEQNEYVQVAEIDHVHQNTNTKLVFLVEEDNKSKDISGATTKKLVLTKPDHTSTIFDADFYTDGTDGKVEYLTDVADLDQAGIYNYQVYIEIDGQRIYSDIGSFRVYSNILSL